MGGGEAFTDHRRHRLGIGTGAKFSLAGKMQQFICLKCLRLQ